MCMMIAMVFTQRESVSMTKYNIWLGLYSLRRRRLSSIAIPIINLRRSSDRLRFIMGILGIPIPVRRRLLSVYRPWYPSAIGEVCKRTQTSANGKIHWFRWWRITCLTSIHNLIWCWVIVNLLKFHWNLNQNWFFSFQENAFKMAFTMCQPCWPQYVKSVESFEARCCYWSTLSLWNRMIETVLVTQLNVVVFTHLLLLISNLITIITPPISWVNS